jgi:hypothetical protein
MNKNSYMQEYYLKNRDKILKRTKLYSKKHKKIRDNYFKNYRIKNKGKARNYSKIWRYTIKGIYSHLKIKSKARRINFNLKKLEFINWYKKQNKSCVYCNRPEKVVIKDKNKKSNRLTIDRKNNSKGYELNNIVLCCYRCNMIKSAEFTFKQMLKIGEFLQTL